MQKSSKCFYCGWRVSGGNCLEGVSHHGKFIFGTFNFLFTYITNATPGKILSFRKSCLRHEIFLKNIPKVEVKKNIFRVKKDQTIMDRIQMMKCVLYNAFWCQCHTTAGSLHHILQHGYSNKGQHFKRDH